MEPATRVENGLVAGFFAGSFAFAIYSQQSILVGLFVGFMIGILTLAIFVTKKMDLIRRVSIITLSIIVWTGFFSIAADRGLEFFMFWARSHRRIPLIPAAGPTSKGVTLYPCLFLVNQILFGMADIQSVGFRVIWPPTVGIFWVSIGLYLFTALLFGRGWCGWMCIFGGVVEAFSGGKKKRWTLSKFRKKFTSEDKTFLTGLREEVRDIRYGALIGILLVSFMLTWNVFCVLCWASWSLSTLHLLAIFGIILIFAVILPFMTKKRIFCLLLCPVGAVVGLLDRICPFSVKIDRDKCNLCYDCVPICPMYAMAPHNIERGKPNLDCVKCGKCMEVCPKDAIGMYLRGTSINAEAFFVPLAMAATVIFYIWFIMAIFQVAPPWLGL